MEQEKLFAKEIEGGAKRKRRSSGKGAGKSPTTGKRKSGRRSKGKKSTGGKRRSGRR